MFAWRAKLGKQQEVRADLLKRIPPIQNVKELDQAQAQSYAMFANMFVELGDLDSAEKIYSDLAARNPVYVYDLARFLGEHRDPDQCFAKLNEIYSPDRIPELLSVAMTVVRDRRDKVGDKFDAQIQGWLDTGAPRKPGFDCAAHRASRFVRLAEKVRRFRRRLSQDADPQRVGRHSAGRRAQQPGLPAGPRYLRQGTGSDDPLKLIQEATDIMGPNSDILDTRAVVLISQKQYEPAIQALELSVTDTPTASKYYHKAVAHLGAGENRAAVEAWQKAEELGLGRDSLNRMEYEQFDEMKKKIDKIRNPSVTRRIAEESMMIGFTTSTTRISP